MLPDEILSLELYNRSLNNREETFLGNPVTYTLDCPDHDRLTADEQLRLCMNQPARSSIVDKLLFATTTHRIHSRRILCYLQ